MSRRVLASMTGLLVLIVVGLAWIARSTGPGSTLTVEPRAAADGEPASLPQSSAESPSIEVAEASPEREVVAEDPAASIPDDSMWIEGRVVLPDGTPVDERVEVVAVDDELDPELTRPAPLAADGSFRVPVPKGTERVSLDLRARYVYLPSPIEVDPKPEPDTFSVVLAPKLGGCIRGRLILPLNALDRRASVAGTMIETNSTSRYGGKNRDEIERQYKVDEALEFELGGLPENWHTWIDAEVPGMVPVDIEGPPIKAGVVVPLEIELSLGARVSGRVVDEAANPVEGVELSARIRRTDSSWNRDSENETRADGSFEIEGIQTGTLTLEATKEGWVPAFHVVGTVEDGSEREGVTIVLGRGLSVSGRVRWPDDRPAGGCGIEYTFVQRFGEDHRYERNERRSFTAHPDGSFEISGLGPDPISLTAKLGDAPPGMAHLDEVTPGTRDLVLTLEVGKSIRGRAVDDTGQPVARLRPEASPVDGSLTWERGQRAIRTCVEGPDGRFEIVGIHDGAWDVTAEAPGHAKSAAHRVVLPRDTESFDLVLPRAASVSGIVTDPAGAPVERAVVRAQRPETMRSFGPDEVEEARTDARGRFVLEDLAPGPQKILAASEGFADSESLAVDLRPGQTSSGIDLALRRGGRIVGDVVDEVGRPRGSRPVSVQGLSIRSHLRSNADAAGHFEFEALAPGNYWVFSEPSERERGAGDLLTMFHLQQRASAVVVEGETTRVVLGGPSRAGVKVHGTITSAGRAAPGLLLWVMRSEGGTSAPVSGATDAQGRYEITVDAAGTHAFSVRDPKVGSSYTNHVSIPAEASFEHDIALPSGRIGGRVIGPDGEPVAGIQVSVRPDPRTAELSSSSSFGWKKTDTEGLFAVEGLQGGTYGLQVGEILPAGAGKIGAYARSGIVLAEGERIDDLEIRLQAPARIEGSVIGPDGEPHPGAMVCLRDEQGSAIERWPLTITDGSGRFSMDGMSAGKVTLVARTKTLVSVERTSVTLRAGETSRVELALGPGTLLRVVVQEKNGKPVGASIRVEDDRGKEVGDRYLFDLDASFGQSSPETGQRLGPIPPGRYKVTATNHDRQSVSQDVSVSGEELVVTLRFGG